MCLFAFGDMLTDKPTIIAQHLPKCVRSLVSQTVWVYACVYVDEGFSMLFLSAMLASVARMVTRSLCSSSSYKLLLLLQS